MTATTPRNANLTDDQWQVVNEMVASVGASLGNNVEENLYILSQWENNLREQPLGQVILDIVRTRYSIPAMRANRQKQRTNNSSSPEEAPKTEAQTREDKYASAIQYTKTKNYSRAVKLLRTMLPKPIGTYEPVTEAPEGVIYAELQNELEREFYTTQILRHNPHMKDVKVEFRTGTTFTKEFNVLIYILIDKEEFDEALLVIQEALKFNPMFLNARFEQCEAYKKLKMWDHLLVTTRIILALCYTLPELAKCYRNFGYYFIEQEQWETACACFFHSFNFDRHDMANKEIEWIFHRTKANKITLDVKKIKSNIETYLSDVDIPTKPNMAWFTALKKVLPEAEKPTKKSRSDWIDLLRYYQFAVTVDNDNVRMYEEKISVVEKELKKLL